MRLEIKVQLPGKNEKETYIFADETVEIGRLMPTERSVTLPLNDPSVSRRHATLTHNNETWLIEDQNSRFGTFLVGAMPAEPETRITTKTALPPGAKLRMGNTWLTLYYDPPEVITGSHHGMIDSPQTIDPLENPTIDLDAYARLEVFDRIARIQRTIKDKQPALMAVVAELKLTFGTKADHAGVIQYQDSQLLPVAHYPPEKSYVSFKLARRAVEKRESFRWGRSANPDELKEVRSLTGVASAIYAPIMNESRIVGLLHVNSLQPEVSFTEDDLEQLREVARYVGMFLMKAEDEPLVSYPLVFISYSRSNEDFIKELAADLRRRGVNVWYDHRLRAGAEWQQQLASNIRSVNSFVLVISEASMQSVNVRWEIEQARQAGKYIIPFLLEPSDATMPDWLKTLQYIKSKPDYQQALARLVDEIYAHH